MPSSIINSDDGVISGTSGLKSSGGDDGNLVFQSKGTETARINTDSQIVAAAGTVSLPIFSTTGDTNTGIFFPAADNIGFATNGVERAKVGNSETVFNDGGANVDFRVEGDTDANLLFVDASSESIGIGTSSPTSKLYVEGNVAINGTLLFNSGYGSVATAFGCRAWVNFNGTGTPEIRASGNVSSITDNGTGDYTVNFTTAMPDANYSAVGAAKTQANTTTAGGNNTTMFLPAIYTTSSLRFFTARDGSTGRFDTENTNVSIFR